MHTATRSTGTILDEIVAYKHTEIAAQMRQRRLTEVRTTAHDAPRSRDFSGALRAPGVSLIAEIKRASPSAGVLRADLDPQAVARDYCTGGASAISVLTDTQFFKGSIDDLRIARQAVPLPTLRKDFILDPYQVYCARAAGADAILLIAAILDTEALRDLQALAHELGMVALVEVHNREELERALAAEPRIVGVNSRDLHTFEINLNTVEALRTEIPENIVLVAESGIHTPQDVARLNTIGVDAMLIGTSLIKDENRTQKVRDLVAAGKR